MQRFRTGMTGYTIAWFGQLVSALGTHMTQFALSIWAWEVTGEATALALVAFASYFPRIALAPLAGALVDRWNRKTVLILSDLGAGAGTAAVLALFLLGRLEIWHLYVVAVVTGVFGSIQFPAFLASISLMLPKKHHTRANTMLPLVNSIAGIIAPGFAGAVLAFSNLGTVLLIDIVSFCTAVALLLIIPIPQPRTASEPARERRSLWAESLFGLKYILRSRSLRSFVALSSTKSALLRGAVAVIPAMVLARTGSDEIALGLVMMQFGIGALVGGAIVSLCGGPRRRRMLAVLISGLFTSLAGTILIGVGSGVAWWAAGAFFSTFMIPLSNGTGTTIWQSKIPPEIQGRVFSSRIFFSAIGCGIAYPLTGTLADHVFEPFMAGSSAVAGALARVFGAEPGAGMSLLIAILGGVGVVVSVIGLLSKPIRNIETLLPDHDEF